MKLPRLEEIEEAQRLIYRYMPATPQYTWPLLNERLGEDSARLKSHPYAGAV